MLVAKREVYSYMEEENIISPKPKEVKKNKKSNALVKMKAFGLALFTLIVCLGVLFGYAQITQIKMEVTKLDKEITELKKHKTDISLELEKIKESGWIEQEAEAKLGMSYPTDEQIVYISVEDNSVQNDKNEEQNGKDRIAFLSLFNYLTSKISNKF